MLVQAYNFISHDLLASATRAGILLQLEVVAAVLVLWALWYFYAFTLTPLLNPQSPKELPYGVPYLGHAFAFIKDAQALVDRGRKYFRNTSLPFAITVGGQKLYILTSLQDVTAVYNNNVTLSWDEMMREFLLALEFEKKAVHKVWEKLPVDVLLKSRPETTADKMAPLPFAHSTKDLMKRQMLPGPRHDQITQSVTTCLQRYLTPESVRHMTSDTGRISLRRMCNEVLVHGITDVWFGPKLYELEPEMTQYMIDFEEDAWMLLFKYPHKADSKLNIARNKVIAALSKFVQLPPEEREGQSWMVESLIYESGTLSTSPTDQAVILLMVYWASIVNPCNLAFWMLSHIFFNPTLHAQIKAETAPAFHANGTIDIAHLTTSSPRLESLWQETMRVTNTSLSARRIIAPTLVSNQILQPGNTILIPMQLLHNHADVFGADAKTFDAERFLNTPALAKSWAYRPFGGGSSYCPGRYLAKQEMVLVTAAVVNLYESRLVPGLDQPFPSFDRVAPSIGINAPGRDEDVWIEMKPKV